MMSTKTDPRFVAWTVDDDVIRLREWASDKIHVLPEASPQLAGQPATWLVGAGDDCPLQLHDPSRRISRHHARLMRERERWSLFDIGSKNGLRVDGARQATALLDPGIEIGIGGLTLIAESHRLIELRSFLCRILGWGLDKAETIDLALRAIRMAQARRTPLVFRGEGDLVPIAHDLHRRVLGPSSPFVLCDPRRQSAEATVRSSTNFDSGQAALAAARGGSLCIRSSRPPTDFPKVLRALQDPDSQCQLMVCDTTMNDLGALLAVTLAIPPLRERAKELLHIIQEYMVDAAIDLDVPVHVYTEDRDWVLRHSSRSLHEIEKGARRIVALRAEGSVLGAALKLGMAPVSLRRWIGRRAVPSLRGGSSEILSPD